MRSLNTVRLRSRNFLKRVGILLLFHFTKALVRSEFLAALALALSRKIYIRANFAKTLRSRSKVLSAAQFCAHFKNLESFQFTLMLQFFAIYRLLCATFP